MRELAGKAAVVTGGASGIGYALGARLGAAGMKLVVADVEEAALDRAVERLTDTGIEVVGVCTDVSEAGSVEDLRDLALERFGSVQVLCNNAGVGGVGPAWDLPLWRWVVGVNLWGVVHGIHAFLPHLLEQGEGHIVNTASAAGVVTSPVGPAYIATKHAVVGLSERLYLEVHQQGVGVSVLCPGVVSTNILHADRNWPGGLGPNPQDALSPEETALLDAFSERLQVDGLPPDEVARCVIEAIVADRFWVFTHPETALAAVQRMSRAAEGHPPAF